MQPATSTVTTVSDRLKGKEKRTQQPNSSGSKATSIHALPPVALRMPMLSQFQMHLRAFLVLASKVWTCICYMFNRQVRAFVQHQPVKYELFPLTPVSRHRLNMVQRKTLVLDLDETLIHSHHDAMPRNTVKPGTPHDFTVKVTIDRHPVRFFVHKRPHVDYFLDIVSQWYDLVVFTASMEIYGAAVADKLDNGRNILRRRYYRQHCTPDFGSYTKDLSAICSDLNRIFIIDNSPGAYRCFPNNAIPIKSWFSDPMDICLLSLLPLLDALRFTNDVRSVLSRNLHLHRLW
ncbi:CTD nuclear envelope phosphatase 1 homolog isoform X1 [Anopheles albimanus]|uniref:CTD nuclear envelope phosphatase 1 homolog isoform X1 n=1 Tax=Anopheles albimanus TaxID=7167 RepID=UPI00163EC7DD|nr:CTD nuclear envelope phosphatase 1 homolog isoform X1 [Anopheles albimanus]XP_035789884.1 CTD nuclear envelope phosphatase 1 homolog isoform X1 [Anopheles albimanus]XP_035789885.1 CTD nuclear envelope phosphatase 1 homolog isoform X1 [Anopheles albimanus]XP_035789886.1 CTD nuclear envelope phosphatase 1 homolog isoform X1 [Anopheles albimanus]